MSAIKPTSSSRGIPLSAATDTTPIEIPAIVGKILEYNCSYTHSRVNKLFYQEQSRILTTAWTQLRARALTQEFREEHPTLAELINSNQLTSLNSVLQQLTAEVKTHGLEAHPIFQAFRATFSLKALLTLDCLIEETNFQKADRKENLWGKLENIDLPADIEPPNERNYITFFKYSNILGQRNLLNGISLLDLGNTELTRLFNGINNFPALQHLYLRNNRLQTLPNNFNPPALQYLYIRNNRLQTLPDNFNPPALQLLHLDNNRLQTLPDNFNPPALQNLSLDNNRLQTLPNNFNPPALQYLRLDNNKLQTLPNNFNPPALQYLYLDNNSLQTLPNNFNPPALQYLFLRKNRLQTLPDNFNPPALQNLSLDNNGLQTLPNNFNPPALRYLSLRNNRLQTLPNNFNPPALQILSLDNPLYYRLFLIKASKTLGIAITVLATSYGIYKGYKRLTRK